MIKIAKLSKRYNELDEKMAVNNVSADFSQGKLTAIVGASGSGKSSLLNMIGGLLTPTSGSVVIDNEDVFSMTNKELSKLRNKKIGFIFQSFYLEDDMQVLDNIVVPQIIAGINKKDRENKAIDLINKLGLDGKQNKRVKELSGGEKQRVCIARALINDPDIILADEPTGNLDSENGKIVLEILKGLALDGKTVLLVTHNMQDANKYADKIIEMKDGSIVNEIKWYL